MALAVGPTARLGARTLSPAMSSALATARGPLRIAATAPLVRVPGVGEVASPASARSLRNRRGEAWPGCGYAQGRLHAQTRMARRAVSDVAAPAPAEQENSKKDVEPEDDRWQIKILYDGDCPLCMKEVDFLQDRNKGYGTLKFVDISAPDYSPGDNAGVTFEEAMGHIHGITRDGEIVTGIEAFRKFYEAIGLGWVYAATKLKPVQVAADAVYEVWAKYRLPLTGRGTLEAVLRERKLAKEGVKGCNEEEECEAPW